MPPVSMSILFPACVDVLREDLRPLYYKDLTRKALKRLGIPLEGDEFRRAAEDVREKLLEKRAQGTAYYNATEKPVAVLSCWFPAVGQRLLLNGEAHQVTIPGDARCGEEAAFELAMRQPHLVTKVPSADPAARWRGAARGLCIEKHVSAWFRAKWPEFWLPPKNNGRYDCWCDHDFRLRLEACNTTYLVDVMGPRRNGLFGLPLGGGKRPADYHLMAEISPPGVVLQGFHSGKALPGGQFSPEETLPISWLIVWLNCEQQGIRYREIRRAIQRPGERVIDRKNFCLPPATRVDEPPTA